MEALTNLINNGYLECEEKYVDIEKRGPTYRWLVEKMNQTISNEFNSSYPIWCWVKFKNGTCPPKHKRTPVKGFDVKIIFRKKKEDVFITDYEKFSFLLNNMYIPNNLKEKRLFEEKLKKNNITKDDLKAYVRPDKYISHRTDRAYLDICEEIRNSFCKCITAEGEILQGCVWRINLDEVEDIQFLNDKDYCYGSFNYKRKNGKRFDWINEYYKKLK